MSAPAGLPPRPAGAATVYPGGPGPSREAAAPQGGASRYQNGEGPAACAGPSAGGGERPPAGSLGRVALLPGWRGALWVPERGAAWTRARRWAAAEPAGEEALFLGRRPEPLGKRASRPPTAAAAATCGVNF